MPGPRRRNAHHQSSSNNLILDEVELVERDGGGEEDSDTLLLMQDSDEASEDDRLLSPKRKAIRNGYRSSSGRRSRSPNIMSQHLLSEPRMSFCDWLLSCCKKPPVTSRTIPIGRRCPVPYCNNVYRNQKYSVFTFVPKVLFNQFKNFMDMFFLGMACSQFIPFLRIGLIYTYWGPLCFVTFVTLCREGFDDFRRFQRDREVNSSRYTKLTSRGKVSVSSADLKVGDLVFVEKGQRVPADMILLRTKDSEGSCFLRTDQLDGETDWKKREAIHATQNLPQGDQGLLNLDDASVYVEAPNKEINVFVGTLTVHKHTVSVNIENTMWANTVLASGTATGIIIYTGPETRASMNNSKPRSKTGLIDRELNYMIIILLVLTGLLSVTLTLLKGFDGPLLAYFITAFRFILLFSYLVPISLRVNLDLAKIYYCKVIDRDKTMPGAVSRSTTIPEELGRISYLLTDKTGTLTQNEMVFKKLMVGTASYSEENFRDVRNALSLYFNQKDLDPNSSRSRQAKSAAVKKVGEAVKALALCHNVTPVREAPDGSEIDEEAAEDDLMAEENSRPGTKTTFQAASPDEIALAQWSTDVGLALTKRKKDLITLKTEAGRELNFAILQIFPFTSETKRMGIIVKDLETNEFVFYLKGADVVMLSKVLRNDWLEEEVGSLAKEGLRTLVVAKKTLSSDQYNEFERQYTAAKNSIVNRQVAVAATIEALEREMELICVTGVEDKLQRDVRESLECLRNAGIRIWMLTGDKQETAACIAKSSGLFAKDEQIHFFGFVSDRETARQELSKFRRKPDGGALIIAGDSLKEVLKYDEIDFIQLATKCSAVVCCRCSPEQKADIVTLVQSYTKKSAAAIGDGGNDVSMIQAANVGVGIVGKEGRQASLAADFSITQFSHVTSLFLVHGRNSYKRSAALSQFVMHRGLIISTMQAIFSAVFGFIAISLYPSVLMVLYATAYTSFPVFSLVLDTDVPRAKILEISDLYKELVKGRSLSYKTFMIWVLVSMYQGSVIMFGALLLFEVEFINIIAISFSALILTELLMVAITVKTWHWLMAAAELFALVSYILSIIFFKDIFDRSFVTSVEFFWKTTAITAVSCVPLFCILFLRNKISPPTYQRIQ